MAFLAVVLTLCGLATALFALLAVRQALRGGGRRAIVGAVLLALSVYGVGDCSARSSARVCIIFGALLDAFVVAERAGPDGLLAGSGSIAIGALAWRIARRPAAARAVPV